MHLEAYLEGLASMKQVSDVKKIIQSQLSSIVLTFANINVILYDFTTFLMHFHDCQGMQKM